jgi:hypothetical protein
MARILNVHPGKGKVGDRITVSVEYDAMGGHRGAPRVAHVLFSDGAAAEFRVTAEDAAAHTLTLEAKVPYNAGNGPLEVDIEGRPPIRTVDPFQVIDPFAGTLRVVRTQPASPIRRQTRLTIVTSRRVGDGVKVFFPRSPNGPPTLLARPPAVPIQVFPIGLTVRVPAQAQNGRIKITDHAESATTRPVTFADQES